MAEAHSAVAFSFAITHEGWDVNFDREVLHLVWESGIRSWKKRFFRFKVNFMKKQKPNKKGTLNLFKIVLCNQMKVQIKN